MQWGYKKGISTELLLNLTEHQKMTLDTGKTVGVLFIDFKKACDSVDHTILLNKVQGKGLAGELHEWLTDYLTGRQQYTDLNGVYSKTQMVEYGVPQCKDLYQDRDYSIEKLNQMASEIQQWCSNYKLTAHLDKTEAMITAQRPFIGPVKPYVLEITK